MFNVRQCVTMQYMYMYLDVHESVQSCTNMYMYVHGIHIHLYIVHEHCTLTFVSNLLVQIDTHCHKPTANDQSLPLSDTRIQQLITLNTPKLFDRTHKHQHYLAQ